MAAKTWNPTSGNLWSTPGNWGGSVPASGDTVTFDSTNVANCTVDSIGTFNGTITVASTYSGTITQSAAVSGVSTLTINGGIWNCAGFNFSTTGNASITVAASKQFQIGANNTINMGTGTLTVSGTATWSGSLTITGVMTTNNGSTLTGTSTPTLSINGSLTINATTTITNAIGTITAVGSIVAQTYTDTGNALSGSTWVLNKANSFAVAANTTMRLGLNPKTTLNATLTNLGTITYSGTWTHAGSINASSGSTTTGTSSPALALTTAGNLTISGSVTSWTSVNVTVTGTQGLTYTDTGAKNTGIWTLNTSSTGGYIVAANTTMALGASPTSSVATGTFTITGTVTYSGTWTHTGNITVSATTGTVTGTSSPALVLANSGSLNISATAAGWTSVNITWSGTGGGGIYTDTGAKNTGIWTMNIGGANGCSIAANTTMDLGSNPSSASGSPVGTLTVTGTLKWSGQWAHSGNLITSNGSTLTGTSSPTAIFNRTITINTTTTITNAITSITATGTAGVQFTDTGNALSGSTWTVSLTNSPFTVVAGTTVALGASPTTTCGTNTFTANGTVTYSGTWTHTGTLLTGSASTVTGSSSPSLTIDGSLQLNSAGTWTSVNVLVTGVTNACTYTDTGAKNSGTWTLTRTGNQQVIVAANTTMALGANPTSTCGTSTLSITGTITWSGNWSHTGAISTTGTMTGTSTPTITLNGNLTTSSATITNAIGTITFSGTSSTTYTDTGDKLNATTFVINKTNNNFTISANTICRVGANPTVTCGNAAFTINGTLIWSGQLTTLALTVVGATGTLTGTSSPTIVHGLGGFTVTAGGIVTNQILSQTFTNQPSGNVFGATFTDTTDQMGAGCLTIIDKSMNNGGNSFAVAANTICRVGANPTIGAGTNGITITGTLTGSGVITYNAAAGSASTGLTIVVAGVLSGFSGINFTNAAFDASGTIPSNLNLSFTLTDSTARTFSGVGKTYGTVSYVGPGILTITGTDTFASFCANSASVPGSLKFAAGVGFTATLWTFGGGPAARLTLASSSPGTPFVLHKTGDGDIRVDYADISDSTVDTIPRWIAGIHSSLVSGNTNWLRSAVYDGALLDPHQAEEELHFLNLMRIIADQVNA